MAPAVHGAGQAAGHLRVERIELDEAAVHERPDEPLSTQVLERFRMLALAVLHDGREQQHGGALRQPEDLVHHLAHGLGGEFLVTVTGMPPHWLEWVMTALLSMILLYTVLGGMLSVLVTDYLQFIVKGAGIVAGVTVRATDTGGLTTVSSYDPVAKSVDAVMSSERTGSSRTCPRWEMPAPLAINGTCVPAS